MEVNIAAKTLVNGTESVCLFVCLFVCLWSDYGTNPIKPPTRAPIPDGLPELLLQLYSVQTVRCGKMSAQTQPLFLSVCFAPMFLFTYFIIQIFYVFLL